VLHVLAVFIFGEPAASVIHASYADAFAPRIPEPAGGIPVGASEATTSPAAQAFAGADAE
jgi:hypothetical protein